MIRFRKQNAEFNYVITYEDFFTIRHCGNCSNNIIGDLNTTKAKLRGAKYQTEKAKTVLCIHSRGSHVHTRASPYGPEPDQYACI